MAWETALATIAAAALSAGANYVGQQQANSANVAMNRGQMEWMNGNTNLAHARAVDSMREQNNFSAVSQYRAMDFARAMTEQAQDFSANMANSSYQRGMADMKAAGLNPILAYRQGGATSPQGVSASAPGASPGGYSAPGLPSLQPPQVQNELGGAVSSAIQAANVVGGLQQMQANIGQTEANTRVLEEQVALNREQQNLTRANTALAASQTATEGQRTGLVSRQAATEAMNPALRQAQTAAQAAAAGESGERTRGMSEVNRDYRIFGPPSSARDAVVSGERAARSITREATPAFRDGLDRVRQWFGGGGNQGPRAPSPGPVPLPPGINFVP